MGKWKPPNRRFPKIFVNSCDEIYIFLAYTKDSEYEIMVVGTVLDQFVEEDLEELQLGYAFGLAGGGQGMEGRGDYDHLPGSVELRVLPFTGEGDSFTFDKPAVRLGSCQLEEMEEIIVWSIGTTCSIGFIVSASQWRSGASATR